MRILLASFLSLFTINVSSQCSVGCDRTNPGDANLTVAAGEVVCISTSKVFGTIAVQQGFPGPGGELRICGSGTVLEATASFSVNPDFGPWNGGTIKLFDCGRIVQNGSFDDGSDVAIEAFCSLCGSASYPLDTAVQVTGSKVLTGWSCTQVLPVEMIDFSIYKNENNIHLSWTTGSEINNDYFDLEFSLDGINWTSLAVLQGAGNSQEVNRYGVIDYQVTDNVRYYRIKQVDFDGTIHYSDVKVARLNGNSPLVVYQNVENDINVEVDGFGSIDVVIVNSAGQIVRRTNFVNASQGGVTKVRFSSDGLASGIYYVRMLNGQNAFSQKVLISK